MKSKHIQIDDALFVDLYREQRSLVPEVIYAEGKTDENILLATKAFIEEKKTVFISRLKEGQAKFLMKEYPELVYNPKSKVAKMGKLDLNLKGAVSLVAAGTSDLEILAETKEFLEYVGVETIVFGDVGVASLGRLLHHLSDINKQDVLIVFAGMEGALPSVVAGLTSKPVIGVPTSIGYGVSKGGFASLLGMLSSCSPGIMTVNIDNGIGAAAAAIKIIGIKE